MRRRITSLLLVLVAVGGSAGCSAVGKLPVQFDEYARGLAPDSARALVYVVRPSNAGKISKFVVTCDGDSIGATGGRRYIYTLQPPGKHLFVSRAENRSELPIALEGGRTYFLEQKIRMGLLSARNSLERVGEAEGREKLAKCSLSEELVAVVPGSEAHMQKLAAEKQKRIAAAKGRDRTR